MGEQNGATAMSRPGGHRPVVRVMTSPMFLAGALIGLVALLGWTFWPAGAGEDVARDALGGDERNMASLAFLFLKAPVAMIVGGLGLDFLYGRLFGKGGA
jgi:hypothetical protein